MLRNVLGVAAGAVLWMLVFFLLTLLLAQLWPDYAVHGREWMRQKVFTFTTLMACCNLVFWVKSEIAAGWAVERIATSSKAVWVLAALIGIYLASLHLVLYWSLFPWWYNLGVVVPAVPAVLFGSSLERQLRAAAARAHDSQS
jgi:hypothetical protein